MKHYVGDISCIDMSGKAGVEHIVNKQNEARVKYCRLVLFEVPKTPEPSGALERMDAAVDLFTVAPLKTDVEEFMKAEVWTPAETQVGELEPGTEVRWQQRPFHRSYIVPMDGKVFSKGLDGYYIVQESTGAQHRVHVSQLRIRGPLDVKAEPTDVDYEFKPGMTVRINWPGNPYDGVEGKLLQEFTHFRGEPCRGYWAVFGVEEPVQEKDMGVVKAPFEEGSVDDSIRENDREKMKYNLEMLMKAPLVMRPSELTERELLAAIDTLSEVIKGMNEGSFEAAKVRDLIMKYTLKLSEL